VVVLVSFYYWGSIFVGGCLCVMWSREVGLRGE